MRIGYVLTAVRGKVQAFGDAGTYRLLAELLADGEGYIRPREFLLAGERIPTAEFPPLWPMVLSVADLLGLDGVTEQRLVGSVVGATAVVVIGLLGAAVSDRVVGVIAAFGAAVYPQFVILDGSLLSEGLYLLLVSVVLLAVVSARIDGDGSTRWWWVASGALGLAVITRSEAVLLVPLLVVPATRRIDRAVWLRLALLASTGVIVTMSLWTVRNAVSLGHAQPFTNNSGTLIAGANCGDVYDGVQIGLWRLDCVTAIDVGGRAEGDAAAFRRTVGLEYATDHLGQLPAVAAVRVLRTLGAWDIRTQLYFESLEGRDYQWLWAGWFMWLAMVPLATVGLVSRRRSRLETWPLVVPVLLVVVTAAVSYGNQRFRILGEPSMVVLAAVGLQTLTRHMRMAGRRSGDLDASRPSTS